MYTFVSLALTALFCGRKDPYTEPNERLFCAYLFIVNNKNKYCTENCECSTTVWRGKALYRNSWTNGSWNRTPAGKQMFPLGLLAFHSMYRCRSFSLSWPYLTSYQLIKLTGYQKPCCALCSNISHLKPWCRGYILQSVKVGYNWNNQIKHEWIKNQVESSMLIYRWVLHSGIQFYSRKSKKKNGLKSLWALMWGMLIYKGKVKVWFSLVSYKKEDHTPKK